MNQTKKLMSSMKFLQPSQQNMFVICPSEQISKAYEPCNFYDLSLVSLYFQCLTFSLSSKSWKILLHDDIGKQSRNCQARVVATLIRCIQQDPFGLFTSEKARGLSTNQSPTRQLKESHHPSESERQARLGLFKVPIKKIRKSSRFLIFGIRSLHVSAAKQIFEMPL